MAAEESDRALQPFNGFTAADAKDGFRNVLKNVPKRVLQKHHLETEVTYANETLQALLDLHELALQIPNGIEQFKDMTKKLCSTVSQTISKVLEICYKEGISLKVKDI